MWQDRSCLEQKYPNNQEDTDLWDSLIIEDNYSCGAPDNPWGSWRGVSANDAAQAVNDAAQTVTPSTRVGLNVGLFKTKLCRYWSDNDTCPHGSRCAFAHGQTELRRNPPRWHSTDEQALPGGLVRGDHVESLIDFRYGKGTFKSSKYGDGTVCEGQVGTVVGKSTSDDAARVNIIFASGVNVNLLPGEIKKLEAASQAEAQRQADDKANSLRHAETIAKALRLLEREAEAQRHDANADFRAEAQHRAAQQQAEPTVVYLPKEKNGCPLLENAGPGLWRVLVVHGIAYRKTKTIRDVSCKIDDAEFDRLVYGVDEGDGWIRCSIEAIQVPDHVIEEAQNHAVLAALDPRMLQTLLTKHGDQFVSLGHTAKKWIEQPPQDMWSLSQGQSVIAALSGPLTPSQEKYYTACIFFKDFVEKRTKKAHLSKQQNPPPSGCPADLSRLSSDPWTQRWRQFCEENSQWMCMNEHPESPGVYSPWCFLCKQWIDEGHLTSTKCRRQRQHQSIEIGPLLSDHLERACKFQNDAIPEGGSSCSKRFGSTSHQQSQGNPVAHPHRMSTSMHTSTDQAMHASPTSAGTQRPTCAHPKCNYLVHSVENFDGYCCGRCRMWYEKYPRNKPQHGERCEHVDVQSLASSPTQCHTPHPKHGSTDVPSASPSPTQVWHELPMGSWYVQASTVSVQEGVDLNSASTECDLRFGQVCRQDGSCDFFLMRDDETGQLHVRMRLATGGWVSLAKRTHCYAAIESDFYNHAADLEDAFNRAEDIDRLIREARSAWQEFRHQQILLRNDDFQKSVSRRDEARLRALLHLRSVRSSRMAEQCRRDQWRSVGEREEMIDSMQQWASELEVGIELRIQDEILSLEDMKLHMKQSRLLAQKADLDVQTAQLEADMSGEGGNRIALLKEEFKQKVKIAKATAKVYRKQLVRFRHLANTHAPEELNRLTQCKQEFFRCEIQKALPSLRAKINLAFDNERDIADFDQELQEMQVISNRDNRHKVYETTMDGKPCVLKRIDLTNQEGLASFIKEVKYVVRLAHPLTVPIVCAFHDSKCECGFLQFDKYDCDLGCWMERQRRLPEDRTLACRIVHTMIRAVSWLHSQNVVHGDIKPSNFLWDSHKSLARLHDFETAMEIHEDSLPMGACTSTTPALRTWKYAAPELRENPDLQKNQQTDMFALGICIQDVIDNLLRYRSIEVDQLKDLVSFLTCNNPSDRLSADLAEERYNDLFHSTSGYVEEVVKCKELLYTQNACSAHFSDGRSFQQLIDKIMEDPSYPLKHDSLVLDVVKFEDKQSRPAAIYLHSVDNRRLYCFQKAQGRLNEDVYVRIRKHSFGPTFDRFLGHYSTRNNGRSITVRAYRPS